MFKGPVEKEKPKKEEKGGKKEESQRKEDSRNKKRLGLRKRVIHSMISETKQRVSGQIKTQSIHWYWPLGGRGDLCRSVVKREGVDGKLSPVEE